MAKTKYTKEEVEEAKEMLRKFLPQNREEKPRVYSVLRSVSSSGMSRRIDFYTVVSDNPDSSTYRPPRIQFLTGYIARVLDYSLDLEKSGILVKGCGMDMGFSVVYDLSHVLYGDGYAVNHEWL